MKFSGGKHVVGWIIYEVRASSAGWSLTRSRPPQILIFGMLVHISVIKKGFTGISQISIFHLFLSSQNPKFNMSTHFGRLKTEFCWYHRPRNGRKVIFWKFLLWHFCVTSKWTIEQNLEVWNDLYLAKLQAAELARSGRTSTDYWKYSLKSSKIAYNDKNNGDSLEFLIFIINIS